jgi:hypothetical protein
MVVRVLAVFRRITPTHRPVSILFPLRTIIVSYFADCGDVTASPVGKADKDFIDHTPIGCGFVSAGDIDENTALDFTPKALGRVFVYWVNDINSKKILYRAHSNIASGAFQTTFSDPVQVGSQAIGVQESAQISVLVDTKTQQNRIYVARSGVGEKDRISMQPDNFYYAKKKDEK